MLTFSDLLGAKAYLQRLISSTYHVCLMFRKLLHAGWLGFFWMIWFAARKSMDLTKHSIGMTSSAIHSYSASRHVNQRKHVD
jgi:hypothetical protein